MYIFSSVDGIGRTQISTAFDEPGRIVVRSLAIRAFDEAGRVVVAGGTPALHGRPSRLIGAGPQ
jgi:hypothetical protein